jgi:pyruvate formate lyase activating enzyme
MLSPAQGPPAMAGEDLLAWLEMRGGLLDGVCVSGGEPLIWPDVGELLAAIRRQGYATKVDTNGTRPAALAALLAGGLVD